MKNRADMLFEQVLATGDSDAAYELLQEFFRGFPLSRLLDLLRSKNPAVARAGAFIASELGQQACPLIDQLSPFLTHAEAYVRADLMDSVLLCATERHGKLIARVVDAVADPDAGVRYRALGFLSRASSAQLRAALPFLHTENTRRALAWLAGNESSARDEIASYLTHPDAISRRVAVSAAARPANPQEDLLTTAAASEDEDVASFAQSELRILRAAASSRAKREEREAKREKLMRGARGPRRRSR